MNRATKLIEQTQVAGATLRLSASFAGHPMHYTWEYPEIALVPGHRLILDIDAEGRMLLDIAPSAPYDAEVDRLKTAIAGLKQAKAQAASRIEDKLHAVIRELRLKHDAQVARADRYRARWVEARREYADLRREDEDRLLERRTKMSNGGHAPVASELPTPEEILLRMTGAYGTRTCPPDCRAMRSTPSVGRNRAAATSSKGEARGVGRGYARSPGCSSSFRSFSSFLRREFVCQEIGQ